jgi:outer membrane lipoprotein-sorting protein
MRRPWFWILVLPLILSPAAWLEAQAPGKDARSLVQMIDDLYRSKSSYALVEMEIITPDWQRTLVMKGWSKGMDKMFLRILEPKKESGVGTLRIGNEMWNYLPKTDKVIKVPPSMMMSSWMGSDFTNDDLVKEYTFVNDFTFGFVTPEDAQKQLIYVECRPKPGVPIIWDRIVIAIQEATILPIWQKFYDEKGRTVRIMVYQDVRKFGGRTIPSVVEVIPQHKPGYKTVLRYKDMQFDLPLDEAIFSLRNLQSWK